MSSIVTVTINPALDKSTTVRSLVPEKKMRCTEPVVEPGGGGINVARAICKLGGRATAVYLAGGCTGDLLEKLIRQEGVDAVRIPLHNESRENLVVLDEASNLQYRFGMPGPLVTEAEWQQCLSAIEAIPAIDFLVASGSLTAGVPEDIFARIGSIARKKNARYIVDTSGNALKMALKEGVYLLKPNVGELAGLSGRDDLPPEAVPQLARQFISEGRCVAMVISMGAGGAMLVTEDMVRTIVAPPVKRKSTVGAGDSMVAGMVWSLSKGASLLEAAKYGVACGTAATMNAGTALCHPEDVQRLYRILSE